MQTLLFVAASIVVAVVLFKVRSDAADERKAVLARLAVEKEARGDYSPLAEVFREAGVNEEQLAQATIPPRPATTGEPATTAHPTEPATTEQLTAQPTTEPTAQPPTEPDSTETAAADIGSLFAPAALPAGLAPFGPVEARRAMFVTEAAPAVVRAGLADHLERLGCSLRWTHGMEFTAEAPGVRLAGALYPDAATATSGAGAPMFPGISAGQCVVSVSTA